MLCIQHMVPLQSPIMGNWSIVIVYVKWYVKHLFFCYSSELLACCNTLHWHHVLQQKQRKYFVYHIFTCIDAWWNYSFHLFIWLFIIYKQYWPTRSLTPNGDAFVTINVNNRDAVLFLFKEKLADIIISKSGRKNMIISIGIVKKF